MSGSRWLAIAALLLTAPRLSAQSVSLTQAVDSGKLVRMTIDTQHRLRGRLTATLLPGAPLIRYCRFPGPCILPVDSLAYRTMPIAQLQRLEVQRGSKGPRYGLFGVVLGAVAGYYLGQHHRTNCDFTCQTNETQGAVTGGFVGGILGLGLGLTIPTWRVAR